MSCNEKGLQADKSRFCMNNLHFSPSVAHCFRFHYKQFFFWYIYTWLEPVDTVLQYSSVLNHWAYSPATLSEQRHSIFPGLAWVPYQEASVFVLGNNTQALCKFQIQFSPAKFDLSVGAQKFQSCPLITLCMSVIEFTSVFNSFSAWLRFIFLEYQLWKINVYIIFLK